MSAQDFLHKRQAHLLHADSDLNEILDAAFLPEVTKFHAQELYDHVIIGGGIAGILTALRLSSRKTADFCPGEICLIEAEQALGGRLFFSPPWYGVGSRRSRFEGMLERGVWEGQLSGPGFEIFGFADADVLERHVRSLLTEAEESFLDEFMMFCLSHRQIKPLTSDLAELQDFVNPLHRTSFVVKKSSTPLAYHLKTSTEIFTKKEAENLNRLMELFVEVKETEAADWFMPLENSFFWKDLPKAQREAFVPFLEAISGFDCEKQPLKILCENLWYLLLDENKPTPLFARRDCAVELALELILRLRGVDVRTSCNVGRIDSGAEPKKLLLADKVNPARKNIFAKRVYLCAPLANNLGVLPREALSPSQSRLLVKHRPRSLVCLEIPGAHLLPYEESFAAMRSGAVLLFPVERARGLFCSSGSLLLYSWLDFEDSLQAPAVKEAVVKLRKAACRVLRADVAQEVFGNAKPYAKRSFNITERVVLLPVGLATPVEKLPVEFCSSGKTQWKGVFVCGDGFTFSAHPWKNVVASVQEVCSLM